MQSLIGDLRLDDEPRREAAIARLAVIGRRAVPHLLDLLGEPGPSSSRTSALRTLERIGDERALADILRSLDDADAGVVVAAISAARRLLGSARGTEAVDRLTSIAIDPDRPDRVRLAALDALADLPRKTIAPLWKALRGDRSAAIKRYVVAGPGRATADAPADLTTAAAGELPSDPAATKLLVAATAGQAPLATLHRLVQVLRDREAAEKDMAIRLEWMTVRAAVHQALAARDSRVALYDLRETLEAAQTALPVEFLAAIGALGDASCLEAIATAYAATTKGQQPDWWQRHLVQAFRTIVKRERVTPRHASLKRVQTRWPEAARTLIGR